MTKEQLLQTLTEDSFNGVITIPDFKQRVQDYAKMHHTEQLDIPVVSGMLLDEATQNECWFQIVNTVEDMSNNQTWDEVIEHLKLNYMVFPRNYR